MNARTRTRLVALLIGGTLVGEATALAQDVSGLGRSEESRCYRVMGEAQDTWPGTGNVSTGVMAGSRLLTGTTQYVYDTAGFPTPDSNAVTFGAALTLTTKRGLLEARVVFLFNVVTGLWTSMATIDPASSTGWFARATGTLWFPAGMTINLDDGGQTFPSQVTGHLCLAR
jgi:hypothetical protein